MDRNDLTHSRMGRGRCRRESLDRRGPVRTVSNALEKSKAISRTKGEEESMDVRLWRRKIRAEVVEPVGRKANWEERDRGGGRGLWKAG